MPKKQSLSQAPARETNEQYYGKLSAGRDDYWRLMAAPRHRVATIIKLLLSHAPPKSVVDLGCGNGQLLGEVRRVFPNVPLAGVDISAPQIAENRQRAPDIAWYAADLQSTLTSVPDRFDTIIATEIIEHLDDPELLLRNAAALANGQGSRLLLTTQSGRVGRTEVMVGHVRHFSRTELSALLISSGWNPINVWNEGFPFHDLSKRIANFRPNGSMEYFGERAYGPVQRLTCSALRALFLLNSHRRGAQLFAVAERRL